MFGYLKTETIGVIAACVCGLLMENRLKETALFPETIKEIVTYSPLFTGAEILVSGKALKIQNIHNNTLWHRMCTSGKEIKSYSSCDEGANYADKMGLWANDDYGRNDGIRSLCGGVP